MDSHDKQNVFHFRAVPNIATFFFSKTLRGAL